MQNKPDDPPQDGQHVSIDVHQQARGNDLPTAILPSERAMALVHGEEHSPQSVAPSRRAQHHSSRVMKDRSDWMLCPAIFHQINQRLGPLEMDLFASRLTHQLPAYVSWRPDPMAVTTDAFTKNWAEFRAYANPPWNLIGRVLAQTRRQQAELVLVALVWKAQVWYPVLLEMLVQIPLLIPPRRDLVVATHLESLSEVIPPLAVWVISSSATRTAIFRRELQNSSWHHGDTNPPRYMTHSLGSGKTGAVNGTVIPFHAL